jgi:protoporphyrinogen oxidase
MKAVILGGGIAGLTMGLLPRKENWMLLSARSASMVNQGHAF